MKGEARGGALAPYCALPPLTWPGAHKSYLVPAWRVAGRLAVLKGTAGAQEGMVGYRGGGAHALAGAGGGGPA